MAKEMNDGTFTDFPSAKPKGPHKRVWEFKNSSDKDWTNLWITTGPQAWYGFIADPLGGSGNPPDAVNYSIVTPGAVITGTGVNTEDIHAEFPPVKKGGIVKVDIDFDEEFENGEWIEFTFSYTENGKSGIPVPGGGINRPNATPGPIIENIPGAVGGLLKTKIETPKDLDNILKGFSREIHSLKEKLTELNQHKKNIKS